MYYHIEGTLVLVDLSTAVIDANGVGYELTVSRNTQAKLTQIGQKVKLYTYYSVREDGVELFGFYDLEEKKAFRLLIDVQGVGPKAAMSVLSVLTPEGLAAAVGSENTKLISQAPGVGNKTAARIVLELKDKIGKYFQTSSSDGPQVGETPVVHNDSVLSEARNALVVLGYKPAEALNALKNVDTSKCTVEEAIRLALKNLI